MTVSPLLICIFASCSYAQSPADAPPPPSTTARASSDIKAVFKRLDSYLKNNPLDFDSTFDARAAGSELYRGSTHYLILRPDSLRLETTTGARSYQLISDGKTLTIYDLKQRKFAQVPAPDTPAGAVALATGEMGVEPQVLNFFDIVQDVAAGSNNVQVAASSSSTIGGHQCDGFKVDEPEKNAQWEVWLERSEISLPCKIVYKNIDGPSQTNEFSWKPVPVISSETFVFSPPQGSMKLEDIGSLNLSPAE